MTFKLSNRSKKRREGIDPRLIEISDLAITLTKIDFGHPEYSGVRTAECQNQLFKNNVSKCDGYTNKSRHQIAEDGFGKALDFYAYVNGRARWEPKYLTMVACAFFQAASILGYKMEWGGLWDYTDMPHIQLVGN